MDRYLRISKLCSAGAAILLGAFLSSALVLAIAGRDVAAREASPKFSALEFQANVKFLASEKLRGRGNGTKELDQAARFIARKFRQFGLQPAGDNGSFFQRFMMTVGAKLGPRNSLEYPQNGARRGLKVGEDFVPMSFSATGPVEAPLVFAGYGITAPDLNYDDYSGIDARGKIVIVLRHEPQEHDESSVFSGKQLTTHAAIVNKAINARNHGAVGMILVNDVGNHPGEPDELIRFGTLPGPDEMKLAALHVKAPIVDSWLKPAVRRLDDLRQAIDRELSNPGLALDPGFRLSLNVDVKRIRARVANVVGLLPGADAQLRDEAIVVGAHYDHLGLGEHNSVAPSLVGQVHHGADDNASGTSGLLELARGLTASHVRFRRSIAFVAFAGEEVGLLGSNHYTKQSAFPLDRTVSMLNFDMIGRVSQNRLYIGGTGTSPEFRAIVQEANRGVNFELKDFASGYGASDHMSFTVREVPVLFFFTGLHSDYHRPSDTWEKIDAEGGARVVELVANILGRLDQLEEKPQFVRVAEPQPRAMGGGSGYGPYFGSVPDFAQIENGVRFADVREASPAGKAGFRAGDVLIQFGDQRIENLYDFTYALRARKPGDTVVVTVLRDGERVTREVTLEVRK